MLRARLWVASASIMMLACAPAAPFTGGDSRTERLAEQMMSQVSSYQQEILADGVVSAAEYEGAVLATKACIEERAPSIEVSAPEPRMDGITFGISMGWNAGGDAARDAGLAEQAQDSYNACAGEFHEGVEQVYYQQNLPSEEERLQILTELVACLRDAGVSSVSDAPSISEVYEALDASAAGAQDAGAACLPAHELAFAQPVDPSR